MAKLSLQCSQFFRFFFPPFASSLMLTGLKGRLGIKGSQDVVVAFGAEQNRASKATSCPLFHNSPGSILTAIQPTRSVGRSSAWFHYESGRTNLLFLSLLPSFLACLPTSLGTSELSHVCVLLPWSFPSCFFLLSSYTESICAAPSRSFPRARVRGTQSKELRTDWLTGEWAVEVEKEKILGPGQNIGKWSSSSAFLLSFGCFALLCFALLCSAPRFFACLLSHFGRSFGRNSTSTR